MLADQRHAAGQDGLVIRGLRPGQKPGSQLRTASLSGFSTRDSQTRALLERILWEVK